MHDSDRLAWPFIWAAALGAMVCGHALELWLESLRAFGDGRASYAHPAQIFAIEIAGALFMVALALVVRRLVRCARKQTDDGDGLVPALQSIVRLGFVRAGMVLVGSQFAALIGIELLEQRWSGFTGGVAAVIGPGHATAIAVHLVVGLIFAHVVYRVSRFVCSSDSTIVVAIATFLRRLSQPRRPARAGLRRHVNLWASTRKPPLLALGLANRPPPATSPLAA
ncbi:MAG TPA: hypothetical protein VGQ96_02220 [Candidatus Eremiobacteraceae bacterium]|nr:hypothetical protein [Candidatus Eremiobacteraceae bacterium]